MTNWAGILSSIVSTIVSFETILVILSTFRYRKLDVLSILDRRYIKRSRFHFSIYPSHSNKRVFFCVFFVITS
ncbi:hypothetical protein NQ315_017369 [Exocentrus adspersus]|uniref:Uncharacterized protein n=1 Tax=Exocentrus adspersus TaxID=1586481 RepID=A0AAV8VJZ0_9CUCU|nr:hypothetical protein NQ315_017369 [Exocentrus adspersus]